MIRVRIATLIVAAGLGLVCGCLSLCDRPILGRFFPHHATDACDSNGVPIMEGPIVEDSAGRVGPGGTPILPMPNVTPQNAAPNLVTPPYRVTPQPQSQPTPYKP